MKSSLILVTAGALMAAAGPVGKRAYKTEYIKEVVTVTVTAGDYQAQAQPTAQPTNAVYVQNTPPVASSLDRIRPSEQNSKPRPTYAPAVPKPNPPVAVPSTKPTDDYQSIMLHQHNLHRSNHSAPNLGWDNTLAQYAKNIATGCVFKHDMHQGNGGYGQNLAAWGSTGNIDNLRNKLAASGVTNQWYNSEMPNWQFYGQANPPPSSPLEKWGHFTQVVWKSTTTVGCYTAKCPAGSVLSFPSWYTVCNYGPPGNYGGRYGDNVLPPLGHPIASV
ncbi:putative pathogenesis-related protein [Cladobotryum mycophilum]|uniref:Pathogenesis-related protein n=1 Tax=Cladobotryum mycophilum TaxID=491253 RepID=A0ABR0SGI8_9HYPO